MKKEKEIEHQLAISVAMFINKLVQPYIEVSFLFFSTLILILSAID